MITPQTVRRTWIKVQHTILDGSLPERIAELQQREPDLNQNGWNPRHREDVFDVDSVAWCMTWLSDAAGKEGDQVETRGTYGLKHVAERCQDTYGDRGYVANGDLIAAALLLGLPVYRSPDWRDANNPNGILVLSREWGICKDIHAHGRRSMYVGHRQGSALTALLCRRGLVKCQRRKDRDECKHQGTTWVRHPYWERHDKDEAEVGA